MPALDMQAGADNVLCLFFSLGHCRRDFLMRAQRAGFNDDRADG